MKRRNPYPPPLFAWGEVAGAMQRGDESKFDAMERELCKEALWRFEGHMGDAAEWLGINCETLRHYCRKHGLRPIELSPAAKPYLRAIL